MRTDTERLDFLQKETRGYGKGWIFRGSSNGRGMRLHETDKEGADPDVRVAIDNYLDDVDKGCNHGG